MICSTPECGNDGVFIYENNKSYCVTCRNKAHAKILHIYTPTSSFFDIIERYNFNSIPCKCGSFLHTEDNCMNKAIPMSWEVITIEDLVKNETLQS